MAAPYTPVTVTNYNLNPPADDGSEVPSNEITWAKHTSKIGGPLKTAIESMDTNITAAFAKVIGGGGVTAVADDYTVLAGDAGKLVKQSVASKTITTPAAATVTSPFVFAVLNNSSGDLTLEGNAAETIDGNSSITIPTRRGLMVWTDGTNWFTAGVNWQEEVITPPQGRLTLTSATPILAADVPAATNVYYTPYNGNKVPLYNGTRMVPYTFAELTLALASQHTASGIFDVFIFLDGSTVRVGTGPAWTTATAGSGARGTGAGTTELTRVAGLNVNANAITARNGASTYSVSANQATYVGSLFIDGTNGQVSCLIAYGQNRKWGVWNAYNRRPIELIAGDTTSSWAYSTATVRQANGATGNKMTVFSGLPEEAVLCEYKQNTQTANNNSGGQLGLGLNSTTTMSGFVGKVLNSTGATGIGFVMCASLKVVPFIGIHDINLLEVAEAVSSMTWRGGQDDMRAIAMWNG